jgi:hypothetical protein
MFPQQTADFRRRTGSSNEEITVKKAKFLLNTKLLNESIIVTSIEWGQVHLLFSGHG